MAKRCGLLAQVPQEISESPQYLSGMSGDTFIISGLKEKRSAVAGRIVDLRREADKLQADLVAIDSVLRLYDVEP